MYDDGPLDITDLSLPPEQSNGIENHESQDTTSESDAAFEIVVSSFPTPKRGILKHTSQRDTPLVVNPKNTYENRLENIEEKIGLVENEIEIVKNNCENDIREIKRCLTPAKKLINDSQKSKIASFTSEAGKDVAYFNRQSTSLVRPLSDLKRNGIRQPLQTAQIEIHIPPRTDRCKEVIAQRKSRSFAMDILHLIEQRECNGR